MNTSEEWKSLWSISSVHSPPLLLSPASATTIDTVKKIGPLIFKPQTHHHLFTSPSNSAPHIPPPVSNLSLTRFLHTSSSILPSTNTSTLSQLSSSYSNPEQLFAYNSLQLLRIPSSNSTLAFFPTGSNSDQVGYVILSVKNSKLKARGDHRVTEAFTTKNALNHRIVKISVSPLPDCDCNPGGSTSTIGYLLVSRTFSVHYYNIRIKMEDSGKVTPMLTLVADKLFKSSAVVHACWSPHVSEESLVLLYTGDLFLFDLDSCCGSSISSPKLEGTKVKAIWDESIVSEKGGWLSCDFSWHPRILIVAHSTVVFLVDSRPENSTVVPLLKLGTENVMNDRFLAFSIAAPDRFHFTLASSHTLFLCDIRKPKIPLLRWTHYVHNPSYITVSSMSKLRSQCEDTTYIWASELGYAILLGSFWNCEFSLFCYGPDVTTPCGKSFYAWGLPSDLSLVTNECGCGCCIVKEEFFKDMLPGWINWQQKKEFVLGFGILDDEISSQLFEPDEFGGFTLIRFTSSGNLESHRYCALWDYSQASVNGHGKQSLDLEDSFIYETGEENYKFKKQFLYLKLDWLDGYLNSDLTRILSIELVKNAHKESPPKDSFGQDFHEIICQKINTFRSGESINVHDVFSDVSLPTSIHEIALRRVWANLPKKYLQFGFSTYLKLPDKPMKLMHVPLEFLEVPCHHPQLPPFFFRSPSFRSSKWSEKQKPTTSLVGPVLPVPFLMTFYKSQMLKADNLPADSEIDRECHEVMKVANEVTGSESESISVTAVSLADDNEDMFYGSQNHQMFGSYKLSIKDSVFEDERHTNLVFRVGQKDVKEVFDSHCPLKFKFDEEATSFGPKEMKSYKLLKRQYSNFKDGFSSYQDYMAKSNIRN